VQTSNVRPAGLLCDVFGMPLMQCMSTSWNFSMRSTYDSRSAFAEWWLHWIESTGQMMCLSLLAISTAAQADDNVMFCRDASMQSAFPMVLVRDAGVESRRAQLKGLRGGGAHTSRLGGSSAGYHRSSRRQ